MAPQENPPSHGLTRRTVWQPPFIFSPSLQSQKFWQEILAGQAKKPLALEQLTEGWGSSEGKVRSGRVFCQNFLLTQQVSPGTVDFHRVVAFLLVDVEDKTVRTEVLSELALDVALQVLVALLLVR